MNISILVNHVVSVFNLNPLVNTIILKDDDVKDVENKNFYPLVEIRIVESAKFENEQFYNLSFEILKQRDFIPKAKVSKLMTDTDFLDNIGICDSIGNHFILEYQKSHNNFNIMIDSYSDFEFIKKDERNGLDGVKFQVTFKVPQNGI